MPKIILQTTIHAETALVFDLSRSIDLHKYSTRHTHETAVAGKISGLIDLNEQVTWRAKHFGIYQTLTSKISAFNRPHYFTDEMVNGAFKCFAHEHHFKAVPSGTLMTDVFTYKSPFGILGRIADVLFLKRYMRRLLEMRNGTIKSVAESNLKWDFLTL